MNCSERIVRIVAATLAIVGGSFAPAAAASTAVQVVERPAHRPVVLRWEAKTTAHGTHFVILRGAPGRRMVAIGEVGGQPGAGHYRFEDSATILSETIYELRGVDAEGREVTLKTVLLRPTFDLRPFQSSSNSTPQPAAVAARESAPLAPDAFPGELNLACLRHTSVVSTVPDPPPWAS